MCTGVMSSSRPDRTVCNKRCALIGLLLSGRVIVNSDSTTGRCKMAMTGCLHEKQTICSEEELFDNEFNKLHVDV